MEREAGERTQPIRSACRPFRPFDHSAKQAKKARIRVGRGASLAYGLLRVGGIFGWHEWRVEWQEVRGTR